MTAVASDILRSQAGKRQGACSEQAIAPHLSLHEADIRYFGDALPCQQHIGRPAMVKSPQLMDTAAL